MANKTRKPAGAKALPGSYEYRAWQIGEAIEAAALFPSSDVYVSDSFPDRAVVTVWSMEPGQGGMIDCAHYDIPLTEVDGGFQFGTPVAVDFAETLVPAGGEPGMKLASVGRKVRTTPFELKSLTEVSDGLGGWEFEGSFSVLSIYDHSKDRVLPGATVESTAVRLPKIKDHHGVTVGQGTSAREVGGQYLVAGRIYPTTAGKDLALLMQPIDTDHGPAAPVEQGSIGFSVADGGAKRNDKGGYDFSKLDIWEVSPVTFGDNDQTRVGLKGLGDVARMPTIEILAYAAEVLDLATAGPDSAKALYRRRKAEGRDLTDDQWKAADDLLFGMASALYTLTGVVLDAEKAASMTQYRHTATIIAALADLIHGRAETPKPDPAPPAETLADDEMDEGKKTPAKADKGDADAVEVKALRDLEANYMRTEFERLRG